MGLVTILVISLRKRISVALEIVNDPFNNKMLDRMQEPGPAPKALA